MHSLSRGADGVRAMVFVSPSTRQRAQGRPGAHRTHGPRATKKHAAEPQVRADHPAFPAQWFSGLYVISPVTGLSCHRRLAGQIPQDLAPASGRQDHTISPSAAMPLVIDIACVHRIPPRVRDDRDPPLLSRRDAVSNDSFRKKRKQNIFARRDWTTQISLIGQAKLDFWRKRFSATLWVQRGRRRAETQPICPSGNGF